MVGNQEASVVFCVNEVLTEHKNWPPVNDDAVMADDYGYERVSMYLFLNSVQTKLRNTNYDFKFDDKFVKAALPLSVADLKAEIDDKTTPLAAGGGGSVSAAAARKIRKGRS